MKTAPIYQIDAFSEHRFGGNPAAVVPLQQWLDDALLQAIAAENNLSETAFLLAQDSDHYALRWFTPNSEVELCGHATLASAWYLFECTDTAAETLHFATRSGVLKARRSETGIEIDLPARQSDIDDSLMQPISAALGCRPSQTRRGANAIALFESQAQIEALQPDMAAVAALHPLGLLVSAPGDEHDFVSRYFAPSYGIDEDPVTGSAHADLMPIWSERLGRSQLRARQLSGRGGELHCRLQQDRVFLSGQCALYMSGQIRF